MEDVSKWEEAHSLAAALTRSRGTRRRKEKTQNIWSSTFFKRKHGFCLSDVSWVAVWGVLLYWSELSLDLEIHC